MIVRNVTTIVVSLLSTTLVIGLALMAWKLCTAAIRPLLQAFGG